MSKLEESTKRLLARTMADLEQEWPNKVFTPKEVGAKVILGAAAELVPENVFLAYWQIWETLTACPEIYLVPEDKETSPEEQKALAFALCCSGITTSYFETYGHDKE